MFDLSDCLIGNHFLTVEAGPVNRDQPPVLCSLLRSAVTAV